MCAWTLTIDIEWYKRKSPSKVFPEITLLKGPSAQLTEHVRAPGQGQEGLFAIILLGPPLEGAGDRIERCYRSQYY